MAVSKFLDPKNDIAFKKIFGSEKIKIFSFTSSTICDIIGFKLVAESTGLTVEEIELIKGK